MTDVSLVPDIVEPPTIDRVGKEHLTACARAAGFLDAIIILNVLPQHLHDRAKEILAEIDAAPTFPGSAL